MARKRQWFLLGLLGTAIGVAVKLVRGRREEAEAFRPRQGSEEDQGSGM